MCGGYGCSRNALAALNILYIIVAIIIIGVASYAKAISAFTNLTVIGGIIACGIFLLLVALIGLIGAVKHHQVCLFFYMIILFLLFILQFALACACLALNKEQQTDLAVIAWKKMKTSDRADVQRFFDCCGWQDVDLVNVSAPLGHPKCSDLSCCKDSTAKCCTGVETDITSCPCNNTCFVKFVNNSNSALKISGGVGLFFSFTEIVGVWLALRFRNQKNPQANPNAFL